MLDEKPQVLRSTGAARQTKKTCGPVCITDSLSTKQTVKYNRSGRVSSRKLMRQLQLEKTQGNESKGMSDMCCQVPTEYIPNLHGNHIWCYKDFTNVCRIFKQKNPSEAGGDVSSPPKKSENSKSVSDQIASCYPMTVICNFWGVKKLESQRTC